MNILLLNPNTRSDITDLMLSVGQGAASPGTSLIPLTAPRGVPYISTRAEAQIGGAVALEMLAEHHRNVDAAIIAAFGDPGLFAARELFDIPVVGMAEAAMLTACMAGRRFGLVTFARALGPWFEECVRAHGLWERCAGIRMLDGPFREIAEVGDRKGRSSGRTCNARGERGRGRRFDFGRRAFVRIGRARRRANSRSGDRSGRCRREAG